MRHVTRVLIQKNRPSEEVTTKQFLQGEYGDSELDKSSNLCVTPVMPSDIDQDAAHSRGRTSPLPS
jgi:hypothetical protein